MAESVHVNTVSGTYQLKIGIGPRYGRGLS